MKYFILLIYTLCTHICTQEMYFKDLPLEIIENIIENSIRQQRDLSIFKSLFNITLSSKLFYIICNNPRGEIQKNVSIIFRTMWQSQRYEELIPVLEHYSSKNTIYKNLCQEISNYSINKELVDRAMKLFYQRAQENIYVTLKKELNHQTLHKMILLATAHYYIKPSYNILNNQESDEYFEKFVYQLTSLYPMYVEALFNKMICTLIYYIKGRNHHQPKSIEHWISLFAQTLVY